jgi:hypothetical protein
VALVTEMLLVSGVALDPVGARVLSHAHNAESIVELREDIGEEGAAMGEPDRSLPTPSCWQKTGSAFYCSVGLSFLTECRLRRPRVDRRACADGSA